MATKAILAILAVNLFLLQVTFAKPAASHHDYFKSFNVCKLKDYKVFEPSEIDDKFKPSMQLVKKIYFDLQNLALSYVTKAKELTDQILKEPVVESDTSPEMKKFKEKLEDYEKQYNACDDIEKLFGLSVLFVESTAEFYEDFAKKNKVILEVLNKYQVKDVDDEYKKKMGEDLIMGIGKKIEELRYPLLIENMEMGEKVLKWWDKVKTLKTNEERGKAFSELMKTELFDL